MLSHQTDQEGTLKCMCGAADAHTEGTTERDRAREGTKRGTTKGRERQRKRTRENKSAKEKPDASKANKKSAPFQHNVQVLICSLTAALYSLPKMLVEASAVNDA